VVAQDHFLPNGEYVVLRASPNSVQMSGGAARLRAPSCAVVMQDGTVRAHCEHVVRRAAPYPEQVVRGADRLRTPAHAVVVRDAVSVITVFDGESVTQFEGWTRERHWI